MLTDHKDIVTGLRMSPDGSYLLSNAMDNQMQVHDVRPYVQGGNRLTKVFSGALVPGIPFHVCVCVCV